MTRWRYRGLTAMRAGALTGAFAMTALAPAAHALTYAPVSPSARSAVPAFPTPASARLGSGASGTTGASGATGPAGVTGPAGAGTPLAGTAASTPFPKAQAPTATHPRSSRSSKLSAEAIAIAAFAALVALGCLAWGLARLLAFEPRWALSMRHAIAEAGLRTSATWAELSDWVRLGR